jgi:surface antigen
MFRKSILIAMSVSLLAGSVLQTASAQPYGGRDNGRDYGRGNGRDYGRGNSGTSYDEAYADGYHHGWDDFRTKAPFNDRSAGVNYNYNQATRGQDPRRNNDPDQRWQQQYQRQYSYQDDNYYRECRTKTDPGGIIAGALIGGLLGNALGGGGRRGGNSGVATIAGVVLGGVAGASLTRSMDCDDRSYAYNTYYTGFNSGRAGVPYQWRNPGNGHYGEFQVNDYYSDQVGFRCANFTQQIYIDGRPQAGSGRACQQPDGTWAVVG